MIVLRFLLWVWGAQVVLAALLLLRYVLGQSASVVFERLKNRRAVVAEELVEGEAC
jgi:hypothetical protein